MPGTSVYDALYVGDLDKRDTPKVRKHTQASICVPEYLHQRACYPLMHEPEIQPLRSLILRVPHIIHLLLPIQLCPLRLPPLILRNIIVLHKPKQHDVKAADSQQNLVSPRIQRLVIFAIDVRSHDISGLNEHVV